MTLITFSDGSVLTAAQLNGAFLWIDAIDATSDLDSSSSGAASDTANKTYAVTGIINHVIIEFTFYWLAGKNATNAATEGKLEVKIETSVHSAASWTSRFNDSVAYYATFAAAGSIFQEGTNTLRFAYAPTAGEKSGGLDIKVTTTATSIANCYAEWTNKQIVIYKN